MLQDVVLEPLNLCLGGGDLMLHRRVFLVGLDRHLLVLEPRQTRLYLGKALLNRLALALLVGETVLGRIQSRGAGGQAGVEILDARGDPVDRTSRLVGPGVELLQPDQSFKVWQHCVSRLQGRSGRDPSKKTPRFRAGRRKATRQAGGPAWPNTEG